MNTYAEHITESRLAAGRSQAELAKVLGKSRATVIDIEHGRRLPQSVDEVMALAECVGADPTMALSAFLVSYLQLVDVHLPNNLKVTERLASLADRVAVEIRSSKLDSDAIDDIEELAVVKPMSNRGVEEATWRVLEQAGIDNSDDWFGEGGLPVADLVRDHIDKIARSAGMGGGRFRLAKGTPWNAATLLDESRQIEVVCRDDVYERARDGAARDRWTIAHELGHVILHASQGGGAPGVMFRDGVSTAGMSARAAGVPPFRSAEHQAQVSAAAILMPRRLFAEAVVTAVQSSVHSDLDGALADRFGVSRQAASIRLRSLNDEVYDVFERHHRSVETEGAAKE